MRKPRDSTKLKSIQTLCAHLIGTDWLKNGRITRLTVNGLGRIAGLELDSPRVACAKKVFGDDADSQA